MTHDITHATESKLDKSAVVAADSTHPWLKAARTRAMQPDHHLITGAPYETSNLSIGHSLSLAGAANYLIVFEWSLIYFLKSKGPNISEEAYYLIGQILGEKYPLRFYILID